jgi:hypothetical protein
MAALSAKVKKNSSFPLRKSTPDYPEVKSAQFLHAVNAPIFSLGK